MLTVKQTDRKLTPRAFAAESENIYLLNQIFNDVDLTTDEESTLQWIASWERSTVKNLVSAIQKVCKNKE